MVKTTRPEREGEYRPLLCMYCKQKDLLGIRHGVVVRIRHQHLVGSQHYTDVYWVCKGRCDEEMSVLKGFRTPPVPYFEVGRLKNPLVFEWWVGIMSRLIERGRFHPSAAAKLEELHDLVAQVACREPTEADKAEFELVLMLNGI